MTNILSALNSNNNNIIAAKNIKNSSKKTRKLEPIVPPQTLYKYSITKEFNELQEFRKNVLKDINRNQKKKKTRPLKIGLLLAVPILLAIKIISKNRT